MESDQGYLSMSIVQTGGVGEHHGGRKLSNSTEEDLRSESSHTLPNYQINPYLVQQQYFKTGKLGTAVVAATREGGFTALPPPVHRPPSTASPVASTGSGSCLHTLSMCSSTKATRSSNDTLSSPNKLARCTCREIKYGTTAVNRYRGSICRTVVQQHYTTVLLSTERRMDGIDH